MREIKGGQLGGRVGKKVGEKVGEKTGERVGESLGEIDKLNLCPMGFLKASLKSFVNFLWKEIKMVGSGP